MDLKSIKKRGISEKFEEIAEHQKMSNLIGFRLFLIRFRVEAFPFHQILSQKMFQNLKINDVYVYPFLRIMAGFR